MATTKKTPTIQVTEMQANDAANRYLAASGKVDEINAKLKQDKLALEQAAADELKMHGDIAEENYRIVKYFADSNGVDTVELQQCTIGYKDNPPALAIKEGEDEKVIAEAMFKKGMVNFLTIKLSLNKAVIKSLITSDKAKAKAFEKYGLTIESGKSFFIKPKAN